MYGIDFQEENLVSREGGTIKIILYPSNIYASTVEQVLVRHRGCSGRILGRFLNLIIREQKKRMWAWKFITLPDPLSEWRFVVLRYN